MRWGEGSRLGFEVFGTSNLELQLRVPPVSPVSFESGIGGGSRSFILRAEYFIACYGDEGEENIPWPWRGEWLRGISQAPPQLPAFAVEVATSVD